MPTLNPNGMSKKAVFYLVRVRVLSGPKSSLVEDLGQEDRTLLKFYREPSLLMLKNKLFLPFSMPCRVRCFSTLWTVAHQVPLSMGFPRQEYWSGLPFSSPGDLTNPGVEPIPAMSPVLQAYSLPIEPSGKPVSCTKWREVAQSCPTLCNPTDCSPPGFSVHGIFQATVLEWVAGELYKEG